MERVAFVLEQGQRFDADPQMLADGSLIEGVGLAGQLQLPVQRFVRDAEQGAVGDSEAVALCGDRRRLRRWQLQLAEPAVRPDRGRQLSLGRRL